MTTLTTDTAAPQVLADAGVGGGHRAARQEGGQDQGGLRLPDHHQGSSLHRSNIFYKNQIFLQEINKFRMGCGMLMSYDWISVPLVYTQVSCDWWMWRAGHL